jgi:hypothetical protein
MAKESKNRWDMGPVSAGEGFDSGFASPWNNNVRRHADFEELATIPATTPPATMEGQMDGDEGITFAGGGKSKGRKRGGRQYGNDNG